MTNPRMNERNRTWKRRVTTVGVAGFVALSALIGKQANQSQTAIAAGVATSAQPSTTTINVATGSGNVRSATTAPQLSAAASSVTTASSSSSSTKVNTRTTASK